MSMCGKLGITVRELATSFYYCANNYSMSLSPRLMLARAFYYWPWARRVQTESRDDDGFQISKLICLGYRRDHRVLEATIKPQSKLKLYSRSYWCALAVVSGSIAKTSYDTSSGSQTFTVRNQRRCRPSVSVSLSLSPHITKSFLVFVPAIISFTECMSTVLKAI